MIHNRQPTQHSIHILIQQHPQQLHPIIHTFTPSPQIPHLVINKFNFYLSLRAPLTFKNPKQPKQVPKHVPIDRFLCETDA
ncbi:TatD family hydrolase, partial [Staphylococcus epidermidis]|uniref:TatD family hydrolase n=1 Tax=Staphylococcus epidermidis TaxID=1282 RepID=UPI0028CBA9CF